MFLREGWRPSAAPRHPVLFINPRSGDGKAVRVALADHAYERDIEAVVLPPGQNPRELAQEAVSAGADALGMAGGDGSLAAVASVAAAHGIPFVCIPVGTRNHFALDLGVRRHDVLGALAAFTSDGIERRVDVADVNGRMFLNNVSLGIYGDAVRSPGYRDAKVRTLIETAGKVLGPSGRAPSLRLIDDAGRETGQLTLVLVSNNPYALDRPFARGTRPRLDGGRLGVIVLHAPGDGTHPPARAWTASRLDVIAADTVHAGVDGEAVDLESPVTIAIRPGALRVRISARHPGMSPSAPFPLPRKPRWLQEKPAPETSPDE
ncbi:diacylglycerol/lipid kinase family protein [Actinopolymorpha singaporensis]